MTLLCQIQKIPVWTFEQAQIFSNNFRSYLKPFGYDIGLTGSVLFRGESEKDMDVILYPMKRKSDNFDVMYQSLTGFGLKFVRLPNKNLGYIDDGKHVEIWEFDGKRVDIFFLK